MMKIESFRQVWTGPKEDYLLSSLQSKGDILGNLWKIWYCENYVLKELKISYSRLSDFILETATLKETNEEYLHFLSFCRIPNTRYLSRAL